MAKPAQIKTKPTELDVNIFIENITDEKKRKDSQVVLQLMQKITKEKPKIWGSSMIGFGDKRYKSPATGREVDWFTIGFSPRKANLSLHLVIDMKKHATLLNKLGKHKTGVGCLYINKLEDVDLKVLEKLIEAAVLKKTV
ncbi:MAG TPA: DUF1801 domain-containing protein [Ferruginibacter sp.]|nr:DUF1801 domain-containing protein [Ferruginibacter sp.]